MPSKLLQRMTSYLNSFKLVESPAGVVGQTGLRELIKSDRLAPGDSTG